MVVAEKAKLGKIMTTNHKFGLLRLLHKQKSHKRDGWWTYIYGTYVICMLSQTFAKKHHIMEMNLFLCKKTQDFCAFKKLFFIQD